MRYDALTIFLVFVGAACARPAANTTGPSNQTPTVKPTSPSPQEISPFGTWRGYIEAFSFPSGSDRVEIVLDRATPQGLTGHARVGSPEASLPTDPNELDAGVSNYHLWRMRGLVEGAELEIMSGGIEHERVQFVAEHHAWRAWCKRQAPKPGPGYLDRWGCPIYGDEHGSECRVFTSSSATTAADAGLPKRKPVPAQSLPFDCAEIDRCAAMRMSCVCKADECDGQVTTSARFDLVIDGTKADGSVSLDGRTHRIRLEKAPPSR